MPSGGNGPARTGYAAIRADEAGGASEPHTGAEDWAVVQLRRDNAEGTLYNLVGFQTHLTFGEQSGCFR